MRASRAPLVGALALLVASLSALSCAPAPARSVVLIVVDTLRADHLGVYGYERETSPELDRLAQGAAVFENAFATSPWTLPSFGSIFTGRLPAEHLAGWPASATAGGESVEGRSFLGLRAGLPTLAETLEASGLESAAMMNNAFLHPDFGVARGFRTYDHIGGNRKRIRRADEVVDRALEWLDREPRESFFLVVHFFDPHLNYDAPAPFRGRFSHDMPAAQRNELMELRRLRRRVRQNANVDWDFLIGAYDEEIAFVDQQIGRLWTGLEERDSLAESLVILTADHGEEFGDHGGFEHGHTLYNELVRIPLIVWAPGIPAGRYAKPVSLIDLYPTVLDELGLPEQEGLPGRRLGRLARRDDSADRTLVIERTLYGSQRESAIAWPYKVIHDPARGETALFHLEEDPEEAQDIARLRSSLAANLLAQLAAYREHAGSVTVDDAVEPDEETLENLRSLGYIQ